MAVVGVALIVGGVALAAAGSGARAGRLIGVVALLGAALIVLAWQGGA